VAADWAKAGWQVHAVSRSGGALADLAALGVQAHPLGETRAEVIRALGPLDAVFDPLAFTAEDAGDLLSVRGQIGHLTVVSTGSVYADDQGNGFETGEEFPRYPDPIQETQARVPPGPGYSAGKVALEDALLSAQVAILRPGAIHGIGARHPREFWFLKRALDHRRVLPLKAAGQTWFHTTSTLGMASLSRHLAEQTLTGAFNIGDPDPLSTAEIAQTVAAHVGWQFDIQDPGPREDRVGGSPLSTTHPLRLSMAKARASGWDGGPDYRAGLPAYLDWLAENAANWQTAFPVFARYGHDPFDYAAEDDALDLLRPPS
jgi:nucleoside-diphosphate-sugar epimerase